MLRWSKTRGAFGLLALALLTTGCAHVGDARPGVTNLTADLVFGAKKPDKTPAPPNFPDLSGFSDVKPVGTKPFPYTTPVQACPKATVNEFPKAISQPEIRTERPGVGYYRWKKAGTVTRAGSPVALPLGGFETRQIQNLVDKSTDPKNTYIDYTFDTVQPDLFADATIVTSWHVHHLKSDDLPVTGVNPSGLPVVGADVPSSVKPVRIPTAGIYLTKIERHDHTNGGDNVTTFAPAGGGVLYLPLPFGIGSNWNSAGVDPKTLATFQNSGSVVKKVQVDACGKEIDSYEVDATQTFTTSGGSDAITYTYDIATSLGGVIVWEHTKETDAAGNKLDNTNNVGQVDPSPTPESV